MDPVITDTIINTEKAGYLSKTRLYEGAELKPRYFRLKNDLFYFATKEEPTPKGVILLSSTRMQAAVAPVSEIEYGIKLDHQTLSFFQGNSAEEVDEWRTAIAKVTESPDELEEDVAVKEGQLLKKGFSTEWKPYWFKLFKGRMDYYGNEKDERPKGSICLSTAAMKPEFKVLGRMAEYNMFQLIYPHTVYMSAESSEERDNWLSSIEEAIQRQAFDNNMWTRNKGAVGWKRAGKVREVISPIVDLLRDPFRLDFFRRFITGLHCEHFLSFWLDVQQFKRLCKKEDKYYLKPCAIIIYQKYVKEGSENMVEIEEASREKTSGLLEDPRADTFRDSQSAALEILRDFYLQFLTSDLCAEMARSM